MAVGRKTRRAMGYLRRYSVKGAETGCTWNAFLQAWIGALKTSDLSANTALQKTLSVDFLHFAPAISSEFTRSRKFCEEVAEVDLTAKQIGKVRLLFYMLPDHPDHKNPELEEIFEAAIPQVAKILVDFNPGHPMEAVLSSPLTSLLDYWLLSDILESEHQERVLGVGAVLLQLLAVQNELREPLNLNGDILDDLITGRVVSCLSDGPRALAVKFGAIPLRKGTTGEVTTQVLRFNKAHTIYDPEFRPPTFRREDPSIFTPTTAIPVILALKRKGSEDIEGEKSAKKVKRSKNPGMAASKKKVRMEQASGATTMQALRSCTVRY
ncbi:hypothetical protein B0H14DRAFT_2597955 [Mycena olivaceomarginata]|nr:hypothetical protein B0H14DRAFT_2597955 [Mycena olivaceomarginata]